MMSKRMDVNCRSIDRKMKGAGFAGMSVLAAGLALAGCESRGMTSPSTRSSAASHAVCPRLEGHTRVYSRISSQLGSSSVALRDALGAGAGVPVTISVDVEVSPSGDPSIKRASARCASHICSKSAPIIKIAGLTLEAIYMEPPPAACTFRIDTRLR